MIILMIIAFLSVLGLVFGSFAGAQVWRLRARQLVEDKAAGEEYDKREYRRLVELTRHKGASDRSRCLSCRHELAWYDLLPLVSWLSTRGRCRYCQTPIGWFEPTIELGTAALFAVSYLFWPIPLVEPLALLQFALWLVIAVMMAILFAYDAKWFLLPDRVVFPTIALAGVFAGLSLWLGRAPYELAVDVAASLAILSGIYLVLWLVSSGRWIGFGDVKLGVILALLVADWQLAFLTLFLANFIGCLIILPGLATRKLSRQTQIPFGPLLILGCYLSFFFGAGIIDWYLSTTTTLML